jgi:hypothetical protein
MIETSRGSRRNVRSESVAFRGRSLHSVRTVRCLKSGQSPLPACERQTGTGPSDARYRFPLLSSGSGAFDRHVLLIVLRAVYALDDRIDQVLRNAHVGVRIAQADRADPGLVAPDRS